jgi:hypothetical protein
MRGVVLTLGFWAQGGLSILPDVNLFKADIGNRIVPLSELGDFGLPVITSNISLDRRDEDVLNSLVPRQSCNVGRK